MSSSRAEPVPQDHVRSSARAAGLELDAPSIAALSTFADLFLQWNARINLGGAIDGHELVNRHFLDAFVASKFVGPAQSVVDVGSGGGLPLVPLAIVSFTALFQSYEPTGKKVAFLRTAVRQLGLAERVMLNSRRLEEPLGASVAGRFDVATSRATFAPKRWLDLGMKLIRPGGLVLVFATDEPFADSQAEQLVQYAPNRRLLVFRRAG